MICSSSQFTAMNVAALLISLVIFASPTECAPLLRTTSSTAPPTFTPLPSVNTIDSREMLPPFHKSDENKHAAPTMTMPKPQPAHSLAPLPVLSLPSRSRSQTPSMHASVPPAASPPPRDAPASSHAAYIHVSPPAYTETETPDASVTESPEPLQVTSAPGVSSPEPTDVSPPQQLTLSASVSVSPEPEPESTVMATPEPVVVAVETLEPTAEPFIKLSSSTVRNRLRINHLIAQVEQRIVALLAVHRLNRSTDQRTLSTPVPTPDSDLPTTTTPQPFIGSVEPSSIARDPVNVSELIMSIQARAHQMWSTRTRTPRSSRQHRHTSLRTIGARIV